MAATVLIVGEASLAQEKHSEPFAVTKTFKIGGKGSWDYVRVSDDGNLLYVPRTTHTQILNAEDGSQVADIPGTVRSHGAVAVQTAGRGFVTDGKQGVVQIFDLKTNQVLGSVAAAPDADGIIFDSASGKLLISCGDAEAVVVISPDVDPKTGKADASINVGGKPEFLASDGAGHAYVNIEDKGEVVGIDTKTMKVVSRWSVGADSGPVGLAIDAEKGRLFVGCHDKKMRVLSTKDGTVLAELPIGTGNDATAFDHGYALASCGDGTLTVVAETSPGKFEVVQTLKTAPGARTMAVDAKSGKVYLPTAEMTPATQPNGRMRPAPNTFKILVVSLTEK